MRPGEGRLIGRIALLFAGLEMGRGLGEVGANALLLARLGAEVLPWLYIALGVVLLALGLGYGAALGRLPKRRVLSVVPWLLAGLLGVEAAALLLAPGAVVAGVAWLTVAAATVIGMTVSWTVATSSVDARQAKRLFPLATAAAISGYLAGSLAAGPLAAIAPTEALLLAEAALFAAGGLLIPRIAAVAAPGGWSGPAPAVDGTGSTIAALRAGLAEVTAVPLLRLVAVAYLLFAVLSFSVSFPFFRVASQTYPDEAELAAVLGGIAALVAIASLVVALVVANRFYARFGVASAALLLPLVYAAGFGLWVVQFGFATAAIVVVAQQVTQRGLSNAAWSAFYAVVPSTRRAQAIAVIDAVPGQLGIILSGVLLLTVGRLLPPEQVAWLGLGAALLCVAVVVAIRRAYGRALVATLRAGAGERVLDGGPSLGDLSAAPDVRASLRAALATGEPEVRAMAAGLLARSGAGDARTALAGVLDDPHPGVREAAVVALLARDDGLPAPDALPGARSHAEAALAGLLAGGATERVLGLRALHRLERPIPAHVLAPALEDADAPVRAMALAVLPPDDGTGAVPDALVAALRDPSGLVRRAAATRLAAGATLPAGVLEALEAPEVDTRQAALDALVGHGPAVRETVLPWAEREVARAGALDAAVRALQAVDGRPASTITAQGGLHAQSLLDFLVDVLRCRVRQHRELVLGAAAVLGVEDARGVLRRTLAGDDRDRRAQAAEAIEALADRRLGAGLARLVDPPLAPVQDRDDILRRLVDDEDRWIRHLARAVRDPAGRDDAIATDDPATSDTIDRMLHLRRVPLFAGLVPEDLQRIALAARERDWSSGADIVVEGDQGDELFVIVSGKVRVVRRGPDGQERLLRTYDAGDHFGELAVLRDRPRAATVVADGPVRTLGLDGQALAMILRERPEAAMAMLATLAERIGTQ